MSDREADAVLAERERRRRARQAERERELLVAPKGGELEDLGAPSAGAPCSLRGGGLLAAVILCGRLCSCQVFGRPLRQKRAFPEPDLLPRACL